MFLLNSSKMLSPLFPKLIYPKHIFVKNYSNKNISDKIILMKKKIVGGFFDVKKAELNLYVTQQSLKATQEKNLSNVIRDCEKFESRFRLIENPIKMTQKESEILLKLENLEKEERQHNEHLTLDKERLHRRERAYTISFKSFIQIISVIISLIGLLMTWLNYKDRNAPIILLVDELNKFIEKVDELRKSQEKESWTEYITRLGGGIYHLFKPTNSDKSGEKESWTEYITRLGGGIYHFFKPTNSDESGEGNKNSWIDYISRQPVRCYRWIFSK